MKNFNIYVDELPKSCAEYECPFNYDTCGCRAKEFVDVGDIDIEYFYEKGRHKTCPLKPLSDRLAEERKKVVQEIKEQSVKHPTVTIYAQGKEFGSEYSIDETTLDKIERGE